MWRAGVSQLGCGRGVGFKYDISGSRQHRNTVPELGLRPAQMCTVHKYIQEHERPKFYAPGETRLLSSVISGHWDMTIYLLGTRYLV